jgi:hypothetical protein
VRTLRLSAYGLPGCAPNDAELPDATLELTPLGDFPQVEAPASMPLVATGPLEFPERTRALEALATAGEGFLGYADRGSIDEIPLLLWPDRRDCDLDPNRSVVGGGSGQAMGHSGLAHLVLMAGGDDPAAPARSVAAATFDTGNGTVGEVASVVAGDGGALSEPRAYATITPFGERLLVAGGENPLSGSSDTLPEASATAEIFDPASRRFISDPVRLTIERSRHTALVLANGDTLLVGGRGARGTALTVLEVISPTTASASIAGLEALDFARLAPAVFRLDDGRIFVGGGSASDGKPLGVIEWLSADAHEHLGNRPGLPQRHDRAYAALPGGGVLAVGGCQPTEEPCGGDCRAGCPPTDPLVTGDKPVYDAYWIDAEGTLHWVDLPIAAPRPVLLGGVDGRPLLATGDSSNPALYRFNPWHSRFDLAEAAVAIPPRAGDALTSVDAGAAVWFRADTASARLSGLRWGTREHFASDPELVATGAPVGADDPFPLVPDRPPDGTVRYDPAAGQLHFQASSPITVYVGAADFANVVADVFVEGAAPRFVLGTKEFGGPSCPWPEGAQNLFRLERAGDRVILSSNDVPAPPCEGPRDRARLGIRASEGDMLVRSLRVERKQD